MQPHGARNDVRAAARKGEIEKKEEEAKKEREREKETAKRWNRSNGGRWRRESAYIHIWLVFVG